MPRKKREQRELYAYNANSGEVHKLTNIKPQCHLPEGASLYTSEEAAKEATGRERLDHCAWCWRIAFTSPPPTE